MPTGDRPVVVVIGDSEKRRLFASPEFRDAFRAGLRDNSDAVMGVTTSRKGFNA